MHLHACATPEGLLVEAPATGLRQSSDAEQWDGFWGEDDNYYVRRTLRQTAAVEWYLVGLDETEGWPEAGVASAGSLTQAPDRSASSSAALVMRGRSRRRAAAGGGSAGVGVALIWVLRPRRVG